ncbi:F0F1 ATP synthase subunit A [Candidatus Gracilibacteria bacterium]|nr:F0F1 ATP synthase subunit A [Candidatus Gracilibacteria bacterium]
MASTQGGLEGLHIPLIQGETVFGAISNTTVTIFIFLLIVTVVGVIARNVLRDNKKSKLKLFFLTFTKFFDDQLRDAFDGDKQKARKYYPLVVGMFFLILFGNLFGLVIDWFGLSVVPSLLYYLRPMHSDLNTTLVLAAITVVYMLKIQVQTQGVSGTLKSYAFNFSGANFLEKCISVFVGWLHAIGVFATTASLSLRLFGNIFAGIILIGVVSALLAGATGGAFEIGRLAVTPLWFFEVFVALIQAIVFMYLMIAYFKGAGEHH